MLPRQDTAAAALPTHHHGKGRRPVAAARRASRTMCVFAASLYMVCSVLLIYFNKAALTAYRFPHPNVITLLQLACSNVLLFVARRGGAVTFADAPPHEAHPALGRGGFVTLDTLRRVSPLAFVYVAYMVLSMASLRGVNLPMYTTLRRTTAAFTLSAEWALSRQRPSPGVMLSVALMVLGALVAGARDMDFDAYEYALVFACNAATALYLATIARLGRRTGLNSFGLMWCNGLLCAPMLAGGAAAAGELRASLAFPHLRDAGFLVVLAGSCTLAFVLNYAIFLNTTVNSALTQTICGNAKDVVVILLGYRSFGGVAFDPLNAAGIALGLGGSALYAACKMRGAGA